MSELHLSEIRCETIGDFIRDRMSLSAYCAGRGCSHSRRLDLKALAASLGADFDLYRVNLRPRLRCTRCGHKGGTFIVSPDAVPR